MHTLVSDKGITLLFALFINDFSKYIEGKYRGLSINNCYPTLLDNDIASG